MDKYKFLDKRVEDFCRKMPFLTQNDWAVFFAIFYYLVYDTDLVNTGMIDKDDFYILANIMDNLESYFLDGADDCDNTPYCDYNKCYSNVLDSAFGLENVSMYEPYKFYNIKGEDI